MNKVCSLLRRAGRLERAHLSHVLASTGPVGPVAEASPVHAAASGPHGPVGASELARLALGRPPCCSAQPARTLSAAAPPPAPPPPQRARGPAGLLRPSFSRASSLRALRDELPAEAAATPEPTEITRALCQAALLGAGAEESRGASAWLRAVLRRAPEAAGACLPSHLAQLAEALADLS
eukprot:CAMPEP_0177614142 /NCGR_PEP_ID=MMETSP0419_2-20121207/22467_1 /TAXON_ID=582737 /ORGANISM="Tetraselmis sp., Strain GSL018" /LENGTH=179 /DNA_ID=CAMNT_0019111119 /DNA_START=461 /DNA_END=997 /DNA_ORIENTATION=+